MSSDPNKYLDDEDWRDELRNDAALEEQQEREDRDYEERLRHDMRIDRDCD